MTLVGKIMIVLILVMSILFMGFALAVYSTHQNWRELVEGPSGLKVQNRRLSSEKEQLENEITETKNKLAFERAARREVVANLETRANQKNQQLLARDQQYGLLQAQHREALETLSVYQTNVERLKSEVETLRDVNRTARQERNESFMRAKQLTDEINQGEGNLRRLKRRYEELLTTVGRQSLVLDRHDLTEFTPVDDIAPQVNGQVTALRDGLIEVSIGSDEGLQKGHTLKIFRINGSVGSYLGSIEIIDTGTDRAVGRVVPGTREGNIRKGDRVATKIL